ncbi:MAG: glutamate--cysteine ligase, partial [Pseudomonadota bacterium]
MRTHGMYSIAKNRIKKLAIAGDEKLLQGGLKGIEKESLRVCRHDGSVAQTPHPNAWGSPLTHPHITTDYSEALTELVTPAFKDNHEVIEFLSSLHQYLFENMPEGEVLWSASMPCAVGDDQSIPIAE